MTREEAIKQLEQLQRFCSIRTGQSKDGAFAKDCKALEMAISDLHAKQTTMDRSRWTGCEHCEMRIVLDEGAIMPTRAHETDAGLEGRARLYGEINKN